MKDDFGYKISWNLAHQLRTERVLIERIRTAPKDMRPQFAKIVADALDEIFPHAFQRHVFINKCTSGLTL